MEWLTQYGEKAGIVTILAIALLARYKEWWVDGPTFKRCLDNVAEVKKEVTGHKSRMDKRMAELEERNALLETRLDRPWRGNDA